MKLLLRLFAAFAVFLLLMPFFVFVISERELAVVLRLGRPDREYAQPGVHFRLPFIETVERFPKTRQFWGGVNATPVTDVTTSDNKKIDLIPWAVWRINSPKGFVQRLRTIDAAEQRVAQISRSAIRDILGKYDLSELVRSTDRKLPGPDDSLALVAELSVDAGALPDELKSKPEPLQQLKLGRQKLMDLIKLETQRRLTDQRDGEESLGGAIEVIDVGLSQVMFVESVRQKTFDRWISEREAISMLIVKEGEQKKAKILNAAKAEVEKIEGLGQKEASELKGRADAEVIRKYADTINEVGDFYSFVRTLEAYEKSMGKDSRMIFTTDSDFFRLLKTLPPDAKGPQ
jgi:modulator of FtsH protease HflC